MSDMDDMTVREARDWLREKATDRGQKCPCCDQLAKVYQRPMSSVSARAMIALYLRGGLYHHIPTIARQSLPDVAHQGGYLTLGQHWGLIAEETKLRDDGGRAGWWRITDSGVRFVRGELRVQKYARLYDGRLLNLTGELVGIHDVLGKRFSYEDLMAGV